MRLVAVPPGVTTTTFTVPDEFGGVVTVRLVAVFAPSAAATPPKVTDVAPARFVPVIVTEVPPVVGPVDGETCEIVGVPA